MVKSALLVFVLGIGISVRAGVHADRFTRILPTKKMLRAVESNVQQAVDPVLLKNDVSVIRLLLQSECCYRVGEAREKGETSRYRYTEEESVRMETSSDTERTFALYDIRGNCTEEVIQTGEEGNRTGSEKKSYGYDSVIGDSYTAGAVKFFIDRGDKLIVQLKQPVINYFVAHANGPVMATGMPDAMELSVNSERLLPGMYVVKIRTEAGVVGRKFMKK